MKKNLWKFLTLFFVAASVLVAARISTNIFKIGNKTGENINIEFDIGIGTANPKIRWDDSSSTIRFANDGVSFTDFGISNTVATINASEGAGTTVLTSADARIQVVTLTANRVYRLPSTNIAAGEVWSFESSSDFELSFESSDTTTIFSDMTTSPNTANGINPTFRIGRVVLMALAAAPTTPGEWKVVNVEEGFYKDVDNGFTGGRVKFVRHNLECTIWPDGEDPLTWASATAVISSAGFVFDRFRPNYVATGSYNWVAPQELSITAAGAFRIESSPATTTYANGGGRGPGMTYFVD